jgi:hypothetical protein
MGRNAVALLLLTAAPAVAEAPLSAIDWLSQSVSAPVVAPAAPEPPVATDGVLAPDVAVSVIGGATPDAAGVLPPAVTGLPPDLWGLGLTADVVAALSVDRSDVLPALQGLLLTILLAEAQPPADTRPGGALILARVDRLLAMGALDQAQALIAAAGDGLEGDGRVELFRRNFDVAMLTGTEDRACKTLRLAPDLAPTFPARIFCLARAGDWNAAALSLRTGVALGHVGAGDEALLARFLDPELYEGDPPLDPPARVTPLTWRMLEAVGEPLPTANLPLAFSHADLRDNTGWKAQIEAAERLVRAGVVQPNLLLGLYTEREPAASGGVWDRVAAFQDFDSAMQARDALRAAATLPAAWNAAIAVEIEVAFAQMFGPALAEMPFPADAAPLAFRIALLSASYERAAALMPHAGAPDVFLGVLARGDAAAMDPPDSLARAIAPAWQAPDPGPELAALVGDDRLGEAILGAIDSIRTGLQGDNAGVTRGLSLLRQVGLEDVARRTALELMLLERRG